MECRTTEACENYFNYLNGVLRPMKLDLERMIFSGCLKLHHAFSANYFVAHAVDYIHAVRLAGGVVENRSALVRNFDDYFCVSGGRLASQKFQLIDGVNNALKHIELDGSRYKALEKLFGKISFRCLTESRGKVLCVLDGYRFDHAKVVLLPAIEALTDARLKDATDVLDFAMNPSAPKSEVVVMASEWEDWDPSDAIDRMIDYCNPPCRDCSEFEGDCECGEYVFEGEAASFIPRFDPRFNFSEVMSQISSGYRRS